MKALRKLAFAWLVLAGSLLGSDHMADVHEIMRMTSREHPRLASKWILGHEDKTYMDFYFWADIQVSNIVFTSISEIVPKRVILVSMIYSISEEISLPSLKTTTLFAVLTEKGWRIVPNEFLNIYLREGEKAAVAEMIAKIEEKPLMNEQQFDAALQRAANSRRKNEEAELAALLERFKLLNLPTNKAIPRP